MAVFNAALHPIVDGPTGIESVDAANISAVQAFLKDVGFEGDIEKEANDLITHEELRLSHPNSLELVKWQPIPIYTGWDADSRQYVITNRYTHFVDLPSKTTSNKTFITTFPLQSKSNFLVTKNLNNILSLPNSDPHYKILEQSMQTNLGYQTIPTSASLFQKQEKFLPVDRGIFFWNN